MGDISSGKKDQLEQLKELSARIGCDPLLTQASTGNTSIKLNGTLWIKASGRWLADAELQDILVPLDLNETRSYIKQKIDPSGVYEEASVETAMHAVLPHRVVMHVHSVNTIAWAVRRCAPPAGISPPWLSLAMDFLRAIRAAACDGDRTRCLSAIEARCFHLGKPRPGGGRR